MFQPPSRGRRRKPHRCDHDHLCAAPWECPETQHGIRPDPTEQPCDGLPNTNTGRGLPTGRLGPRDDVTSPLEGVPTEDAASPSAGDQKQQAREEEAHWERETEEAHAYHGDLAFRRPETSSRKPEDPCLPLLRLLPPRTLLLYQEPLIGS